MSEEGGGEGEGGEPRLKFLEEYSLKTLKQVYRQKAAVSWAGKNCLGQLSICMFFRKETSGPRW